MANIKENWTHLQFVQLSLYDTQIKKHDKKKSTEGFVSSPMYRGSFLKAASYYLIHTS